MATPLRYLTFLLLLTLLYAAKKPKPRGCRVGKTNYTEGQTLPADPSHPCGVCVCKNSKFECRSLVCPAMQEGFCVKEGECCPSPPPCDTDAVTVESQSEDNDIIDRQASLNFNGVQTTKVGKKTYKCTFGINYSLFPPKCIKSKAKCKPLPKKPIRFVIDAVGAVLTVSVAKKKITECKVEPSTTTTTTTTTTTMTTPTTTTTMTTPTTTATPTTSTTPDATSGPTMFHSDSNFKYYKVPVPVSSIMSSATVLSACERHGMKPQCHTGKEGYTYSDSNCLRVPDCENAVACAIRLSNLLCSTSTPTTCGAILNIFWYMYNWGTGMDTGSACGVTTQAFCTVGNRYTSTSNNPYFAACVTPLEPSTTTTITNTPTISTTSETPSDNGKDDCVYNNRLYSLGKTINIVDKCSILTCQEGRLGPQWDIEILGCSCCQHNGRLLKDGDEAHLYNGQVAKCCDGQMLTSIDIPGGIGESSIDIGENGQTVTQQNTFNYSTGLLTIVVPPHIAVLQQDFPESTSMFHEETGANIIKSNSSCIISPIPDDINVYDISKFFEHLKNGSVVWDSKNVDVVYDIKMVKSIVGPEERKSLLPAMDRLCKNEVIKKTENHRISKDKYEKLARGEIVFLGDNLAENRAFCFTDGGCTKRFPDACGNMGWYNDVLNRWITMHTVSSAAVCLKCCFGDSGQWKQCCEQQHPKLCLCQDIHNKKDFERCYLKGNETRSITFQDADGTVGIQEASYNSESNEHSLKIHVPSHGDIEETTVLMHARSDGYWHGWGLENNMMIKVGSTCHVRTLPNTIFPFEIAVGQQQIEAGNFTLQPQDEKRKNSILLNDGVFSNDEIKALNPEIRELCNNNELFKNREIDIDEDQVETLNNGGIIDIMATANGRQIRGCAIQTKATFKPWNNKTERWGCWRWENPDTGKEIIVHGIVRSVLDVTCCTETPSMPENCCDSLEYCNCADIIDKTTFEQCMVPPITVLDIQETSGLRVVQTFAYNRTGDGYLTIKVDAHGDIEETTMVLDESQDLKILKRNTSCHLLPLNGRDPTRVARRAFEMVNLMDGPLTSAMETISTSVLVSHPGDIPSLPDHMDICDGMEIILADEVSIDQAQYYELDSGQIISLPLGSVPPYSASTRMDKCILLTKCASNNGSSCIRWPNPGTGASIAVHGLISTPTCLSCCVEGHDQMYCDCDQITDMQTFQQCLYPKELQEMIAVITGALGNTEYGNLDVFVPDETAEGLQLIEHEISQSNYPVDTSGGVGAYINNSLIVCQGTGGAENACDMVNAESGGAWITSPNTILTDPLTWGGASAKYKSGPNGDEPGETWWIIGGDPQGTRTQEWNSVLGANPWEPPVLPVIMNIPCMVAVNDREIFVTSTPMFEAADTNLAWIYSRDYGWKEMPSLQKKRFGPACGFLPNPHGSDGWIVVAGGYRERSTEILVYPESLHASYFTDGPSLNKNYNPFGGAMVTLSTGELVFFSGNADILAINLTAMLLNDTIADFMTWEVIGKMNQPRHSAVVLTFKAESTFMVTNFNWGAPGDQ